MSTDPCNLDLLAVKKWARDTVKRWSVDVKLEQRRKKNRERTARYRTRKNDKVAAMIEEHQQLEEVLQRRLASLQDNYIRAGGKSSVSKEKLIQQLALERKYLVSEKWRLQKEILKHFKFQTMMQTASLNNLPQTSLDTEHEPQSLSARSLPLVPAPPMSSQDTDGCRVHFFNASPPFHFHPFSRDEFDAMYRVCDDSIASAPPHIQLMGSLFGWEVYHRTRRAGDNVVVAHARFTRRIRCSLRDADRRLYKLDIDSWPVLVTPETWGYNQRGRTCCRVLQAFDANAFVLVRDIPGPGTQHIRYVNLARRSLFRQADGNVVGTYTSVIANSEANQRSRAVEQTSDVEWVGEGGLCVKLTEVDATTIDVTYDHWASCRNEKHAGNQFVRWAEYAVWLQQRVLPTQLLGW